MAIARALVGNPKVILADEPTGNLDPEMSKEVLKLFERFNQVGVSVLIATHALHLIVHMPHRIIHLDNGKIAARRPRTPAMSDLPPFPGEPHGR